MATLTTEQWQEAAKRARSTGTMAKTLCKALARRYSKRWQFVDFLGPKGQESAGVVDLIAIRKDGRKPEQPGLKRLDLFDIILIQVKGGKAKSPTEEDIQRMKLVGDRYGAQSLILFEWTKQKKIGWSVLGKTGAWDQVTASKIFGK